MLLRAAVIVFLIGLISGQIVESFLKEFRFGSTEVDIFRRGDDVVLREKRLKLIADAGDRRDPSFVIPAKAGIQRLQSGVNRTIARTYRLSCDNSDSANRLPTCPGKCSLTPFHLIISWTA